jgi:predicted nucleic acid-binding protein
MTIVSNASPLIALVRIGQLDLLRQLYSEIVIPEAGWHEVVVEGADQPGAEAVSSASC